MSENTSAAVDSKATQEEYSGYFVPNVHKIGRSTMLVSLLLMFLPTLYFIFIKGYTMPITSYVTVAIAITSVGIGMWISEPLAYWPVLGSAGTYIGYLSGNVMALRFPVALSLQSTLKADINTARGQIVTIVGIVASVFVNLAILLAIILIGSWIVTILPDVVLASFDFVMVGLLGSMILQRFTMGEGGIVKNIIGAAPYFILAIVIKLVVSNFAVLTNWGLAISVGACILLAYAFYKRDCKQDEEGAQA